MHRNKAKLGRFSLALLPCNSVAVIIFFPGDDWEEEPEDGEQIDAAEKMSDDEEMDEDDGFFVPHGYLSSDEENQLTEGKFFSPIPLDSVGVKIL